MVVAPVDDRCASGPAEDMKSLTGMSLTYLTHPVAPGVRLQSFHPIIRVRWYRRRNVGEASVSLPIE